MRSQGVCELTEGRRMGHGAEGGGGENRDLDEEPVGSWTCNQGAGRGMRRLWGEKTRTWAD